MDYIVCVGDLVTDLVIRLGTAEIDPVSDTPAVIERHRGGSAANVAVGSAHIGRHARFVGALGADESGTALVTEMLSAGVEVAGPRIDRAPSIAVIVDPTGARRFLTDRGSEQRWPQPDPGWLEGATRLHITGYALANELSTDSVLALAALAHQRSIPVSFDPSSVALIRSVGQRRMEELLGQVSPDVVLPNEDEAPYVRDAAIAGGAAVVTTTGAGATQIAWPDGTGALVNVEAAEVVDTTGAGDAFAAGFLAHFDRTGHWIEAVDKGHALARRAVGSVGATAWEHGVDD